MSTTKRWGEIDTVEEGNSYLRNINFNQIAEAALHRLPESHIVVKTTTVQMPSQNLVTHTVALHQHSRLLQDIHENAVYEGIRLDPMCLPAIPELPPQKNDHQFRTPLRYLDKDYCDFSKGNGSAIAPLNPASLKKALKQIAAISLAQLGVSTATSDVIDTLADALDHYMITMTNLMRTITDKESLERNNGSGFPDIISRVFAELGVQNLHEFYQNRVIKYHDKVKKECEEMFTQCLHLSVPDLSPEKIMEDVPELHFPAALGEVFTPSLEPGFQMLHSLEQEELHGLELLDTGSHDDIKIEIVDFPQPEMSPSLSPRSKKKRK